MTRNDGYGRWTPDLRDKAATVLAAVTGTGAVRNVTLRSHEFKVNTAHTITPSQGGCGARAVVGTVHAHDPWASAELPSAVPDSSQVVAKRSVIVGERLRAEIGEGEGGVWKALCDSERPPGSLGHFSDGTSVHAAAVTGDGILRCKSNSAADGATAQSHRGGSVIVSVIVDVLGSAAKPAPSSSHERQEAHDAFMETSINSAAPSMTSVWISSPL